MRVFIAASLPQGFKAHITEFVRELKEDYSKFNITWVRGSVYHLTLEFLSDLPEEKVKLSREILSEVSEKFKGKEFVLSFNEFSAFPSIQRPRTLVIKSRNKSSHNLADFQKFLHNGLLNRGFGLDNKVWRPHITLGRLKDRGAKINFKKHIFTGQTANIDRFGLYASTLRPEGPSYKSLAEFHV